MRTRSLLLAAAGALAFALAALASGASTLAIVRLTLCGAALAMAAAIDLAERRIPNRVVLPAAAACAALSLGAGMGVATLAGGLALVALLLIVSLAHPAALGMGDIKLALLIVLGLDGSAAGALLIGLALAALAGLALLLLQGRKAWRRALPLAPFLAGGALLSLLL